MNDDQFPPSDVDAQLHALLDQAARSFEPNEDPRRLGLLFGGRGRRRQRLLVPLAAAAALLLMVGTVSALVGSDDAAPRIAPADVPETTDMPSTTAPATTTTVAPTTSTTTSTTSTSTTTTTTTSTVPPTTEVPFVAPPPPPAPPTTAKPTPPPDTTPKPTNPPDTTPKETSPPDTTPKDTTPHDTTPKDTTPKDTTPKPPAIAFTAVQVWGSNAGDPPFEEFHGTAPAGEKVLVHWHTGSEYTYADQSGNWYLKVFFAQVAVGQTIEVKVKSMGEVKYFTFTRTG